MRAKAHSLANGVVTTRNRFFFTALTICLSHQGVRLGFPNLVDGRFVKGSGISRPTSGHKKAPAGPSRGANLPV